MKTLTLLIFIISIICNVNGYGQKKSNPKPQTQTQKNKNRLIKPTKIKTRLGSPEKPNANDLDFATIPNLPTVDNFININGSIEQWTMGIWKEGSFDYKVSVSRNKEFFEKELNKLFTDGYKLIDLEVQNRMWIGIFYPRNKNKPADRIGSIYGFDQDQLDNHFELFQSNSLRLNTLEPAMLPYGEDFIPGYYYSSEKLEENNEFDFWRGKSLQELEEKNSILMKKGLRMVDIDVDFFDKKTKTYTALWHAGKYDMYLSTIIGIKSFWKFWKKKSKENFRIVDVEIYQKNGHTYFVSLWHAGKDGHSIMFTKTWEEFQKVVKENGQSSLQLVDVQILEPPLPIDPPKEGEGEGEGGEGNGENPDEGNPSVKIICLNDLVESGWITTGNTISKDCGPTLPCIGAGYNAKQIRRYDNRPKGTKMQICRTESVPPGWKVISTSKSICPCLNAVTSSPDMIIQKIQ